MKAKLGIAPIAWWNDDLEELSDDVSLDKCLRQASVAGYTGMETGRRFPMDPAVLGPVLLPAPVVDPCGCLPILFVVWLATFVISEFALDFAAPKCAVSSTFGSPSFWHDRQGFTP